MADRPILFSAPMVRALLAGTKTQTRRVVKSQPRRVDGGVPFGDAPAWAHAEPGSMVMRCPYGKRGDRLWVRETWAYHLHAQASLSDDDGPWVYAADGQQALQYRLCDRWRPSIHMPRHASRLTLEVSGVRVERLQDISSADAIAEGLIRVRGPLGSTMWEYSETTGGQFADPRVAYRMLWEAINGPGSWEANPWVWVVEFQRAT